MTNSAPTHDTSIVDEDNLLAVKVFSQSKTYFDDYAESISALNQTGPFDVLAGHANFLTLVSEGELTIRDREDSVQKIPITRGVMHVRKDVVRVYLDV